jgi:hypothetical protein
LQNISIFYLEFFLAQVQTGKGGGGGGEGEGAGEEIGVLAEMTVFTLTQKTVEGFIRK